MGQNIKINKTKQRQKKSQTQKYKYNNRFMVICDFFFIECYVKIGGPSN